MIPLFDIKTINNHKATDKLPLRCEYCGKTFYNVKKEIRKVLNNHRGVKLKYCSTICSRKSKDTRIHINCKQCGQDIFREKREVNKNVNNFCSHSCSARYHNTHKTKGYRRSKLEIYIENELNILYPDLNIDYNKTNAINAELDIYIPSLKIAFELNGIYHYEPIFGKERLTKAQNNDERKFQACLENKIELCIIDTSQQKHFKEQSSKKFLSIIITLINKKLGCLDGTAPSSSVSQTDTSL